MSDKDVHTAKRQDIEECPRFFVAGQAPFEPIDKPVDAYRGVMNEFVHNTSTAITARAPAATGTCGFRRTRVKCAHVALLLLNESIHAIRRLPRRVGQEELP